MRRNQLFMCQHTYEEDPSSVNYELPPSQMDKQRFHFKVAHFILEAGTKLQLKSVPVATACVLYHKFFDICSTDDYDPYLIATTSLYLASKIEEDHLKIRDVINVCYRCLHPDKPVLDIGSYFWKLRESVAQCELFILRVLQFQVSFTHPHKYLVHYLKSLMDWLEPGVVETVPIATTAWALLRDSYHSNLCLQHKPDVMAVSVLYLSLQSYGVEVPYNEEAEERWWEVFVDDIKLTEIRTIVSELIDVYDLENTVR